MAEGGPIEGEESQKTQQQKTAAQQQKNMNSTQQKFNQQANKQVQKKKSNGIPANNLKKNSDTDPNQPSKEN